MRIASKTDGNQHEIINAFRKAGASVLVLSAVGHGCPDLLIGYRGKMNLLVECKSKRGKFTPDQVEFISNWQGRVNIVRSYQEAIELLNKAGVK